MLNSEDLRPSAQYVKKYLNNTPIIAAEIGVHEGHNSCVMIKNIDFKKLYLIDPYIEFDVVQESMFQRPISESKQIAIDVISSTFGLDNYNKKIIWIYKKSEEAIPYLEKDMDYIYIDGDHRYETLIKELELYYSLVRIGGVLAGHDYNSSQSYFSGVNKAVNEFVLKHGYTLQFDEIDWWIIKNN